MRLESGLRERSEIINLFFLFSGLKTLDVLSILSTCAHNLTSYNGVINQQDVYNTPILTQEGEKRVGHVPTFFNPFISRQVNSLERQTFLVSVQS